MSNDLSLSHAHGNRILARLPRDDYQRLAPWLEPVSLPLGQVVQEARGPVETAYFPLGSVFSALTIMQDGSAIEVATVGSEGVVGHLGFGGRTAPHRVIVQIVNSSGALRIPLRILEEKAREIDSLGRLLSAYHVAFLTQISQSVACNGLHRLEQRCCRWLLMSRDRVRSNNLRLTHEFLAVMLGARRASVSEALRPLQDAGLIRSVRGRISILDGPGVEARACECYAVVRDDYDRLLGGAEKRT